MSRRKDRPGADLGEGVSYHNSSFHPEPLEAFPSGTPDRFAESRHMGELETPMRDGVVLRADLYRPAQGGPFPVLVFRTPYGKHFAAKSEGVREKAVARGYAVLMQDVRGRYASGGHFDPYRQERKDGYDTIEWAAAQAWCDGRVGMDGGSYLGTAQYLAARRQVDPCSKSHAVPHGHHHVHRG